MIAEVTITLSDWLIEEIRAIAVLLVGFGLGWLYRDQKIFSEFRSMIRRRRAQRAAR